MWSANTRVREMKQYSRILGMTIWMFLFFLISTNETTQAMTKFIKSEDGDIIECVDIFKQPYFEHVLMKNYTIFEMQQHKFNKITKTNATTGVVVHQIWQKSGNCPSGTIPIRMMTGKGQVELEQEQLTPCKTEFAGLETYGNIYGARADINVWSVDVEPNEWSISAINIYNENGSYIQYGWMVSPTLYDDGGETRLFIRTVDDTTGRWCVMYGDRLLGYWSPEQFPQFGSGVAAFWGGELCNKNIGNRYTTTEMGSGRPPSDGWGQSAYIHGLEVMDIGENWRRPQDLHSNLSSDCYKVQPFEPMDGKMSAYFGGTASLQCCGISCE